MQASSAWAPPGGTLGRILEETRRRLPSLDERLPLDEVRESGSVRPPPFQSALRRKAVTVIAEVKRKSPSKGVLNEKLDAASQAASFEQGGAAAISVLTEPAFFDGSIDDLVAVRGAVDVPVLKKDFHIDASQLVEARRAKASAVLFIARVLPQEELLKLIDVAECLRLESVVEVRTEQELERALVAGAQIIGVNSRDLETLEVDERIPERLVPLIPPEVIAIWESGVHDVDDVRRAADCGADAVLVGSALSRSSNPAQLVRSLSGVPRRPRHG